MTEEMAIGGATAALCLLGLWHSQWFLAETRKGQRLAGWFGPDRGLWVLRILFGVGAVFGLLLATGLLQPMRWP